MRPLPSLRCGGLPCLLQPGEVIGSALRMGGGGEYCSLILLQDGEPVPEIIGVVLPHLRRDTQIRAQEAAPSSATSSSRA